jgi:hypothetical protein
MSNDSAGRTPRSTSGGAPMGSTVAIVVTVAAVVVGFLILKKVNDDGGGGSTTPGVTTSTTLDPALTTTSVAFTTTTQPPLQKTGTKVQVANSSGASGVARQMTTALTAEGFDMADATNGTGPNLEASKVIYNATDPNALPVANALSVTLGGIAVEQAAAAPPVDSGTFPDGTGVILLLGNDLAGKTIAEINGASATGTTAPATSSPVTAVPTTTG